jgi:hypothetical protein
MSKNLLSNDIHDDTTCQGLAPCVSEGGNTWMLHMAEHGIVRSDMCSDVSMLRTHIEDARVWTSLHFATSAHACLLDGSYNIDLCKEEPLSRSQLISQVIRTRQLMKLFLMIFDIFMPASKQSSKHFVHSGFTKEKTPQHSHRVLL